MRAQTTRVLKKIAIFARSIGAHTPCITPRSVAATKKTELLHVELQPDKEKVPGMTAVSRSPMRKELCAWKNLRSLSRKLTEKAGNVAVTK